MTDISSIPDPDNDNPFNRNTEALLFYAWNWLEDCGIVEADDADMIHTGEWTDEAVIRNVDINFEGGWSEFQRSLEPLQVWYLRDSVRHPSGKTIVVEKSNFGNTRTRVS